MSASDEIPLEGGRLTPGVVRVGDTVRRPSKPSSPFVSALLQHLDDRGFAGAPRYLGCDGEGRDTFTFIPGSVPAHWQRFADEQICAAATLLRAFHDATRGITLAGEASVICHHDVGPNNFVFQDGRPIALIDFDMAAPGEPLEDLGYMAWSWCVSSKSERQPVCDQAAQVRILADAYGLDVASRRRLVDAMLDRQSRNARFWRERKDDPSQPYAVHTSIERIEELVNWSHREFAFTETNHAEFMAVLT